MAKKWLFMVLAASLFSACATTSSPEGIDELTIENIPQEALAVLGATMPPIDLSMDSVGDLEVWFGEYQRWSAWREANPTKHSSDLLFALVPDTKFFTDSVAHFGEAAFDRRALIFEDSPYFDVSSIDLSSGSFESGSFEATVTARQSVRMWAIFVEPLEIETPFLPADPGDTDTWVIGLERSGEGVWRISSWG